MAARSTVQRWSLRFIEYLVETLYIAYCIGCSIYGKRVLDMRALTYTANGIPSTIWQRFDDKDRDADWD
jgi:hypothetical protein